MDTIRAALAIMFAGLIAIAGVLFYGAMNVPPETQIKALAKGDYLGKGRDRICKLGERENMEMLFARSPNVEVLRYDGEQAKQYIYYLRDGWTNKNRLRVLGFTETKFPAADRLYIVDRPGHSVVYPFFIVEGCVAEISVQIPRLYHMAILEQLRGAGA